MPSRHTWTKVERKEFDCTTVTVSAWFNKFPFAAFSKSTQSILCLMACVLFPLEQTTNGCAQLLLTRPLVNWEDALADVNAQSRLDYHLDSEARMEAFICAMRCLEQRIDLSMTTAAKERVDMNRSCMCGRQGIEWR